MMVKNIQKASHETEKANALMLVLEDLMVDGRDFNRQKRTEMASAFYALWDCIKVSRENLRTVVDSMDCTEIME